MNLNTTPIDHLMKRADENKLTGAEALQLDRYLQSQTAPEGVLAPITLAKPTDIVPVAYVIHKWTTRCLACNDLQRHDEVFALNHLKSRSGSTFIRNLVPITSLSWDVPITEHVPVPKTVPFCSACIVEAREYVATLPKPIIPQSVSKLTPRDATEGSPVQSKEPKASRKGFTSADDLLI